MDQDKADFIAKCKHNNPNVCEHCLELYFQIYTCFSKSIINKIIEEFVKTNFPPEKGN